MSSDPERSKKAKKMAFFYLLFAILLYFLGIINAIIIIIILAFSPKIIQYINARRGIATGGEGATRLNLGGIFKVLFYLAVISMALYFLVPPLMDAYFLGQRENPLNDVFYVESQDGNGIADNNGNFGIRLGVGSSKTGTTFILRTKETVKGWPAFGADIFASKENSTLKVSYLDADNSAMSIRFKKVSIPTGRGFRYSNKYKIDNYRAWIKGGNREAQIENTMTVYRNVSINHDIELEVYVVPNSYVDLNNITVYRNW